MTEINKKQQSDTLYLFLSRRKISFATYINAANKEDVTFKYEPYTLNRAASLVVNLRDALERINLMDEHIKRAVVLVDGPVTFIPLAQFQEEDAKTIYDFNFGENHNKEVFYDTLSCYNVTLLFALEKTIVKVFEEIFKEVYFISTLTPILKHFSMKQETHAQTRLYAFMQEDVLDVYVLQKNKMLAGNRFNIRTADDAVYYIMGLAKQCHLDSRKDSVYLIGESTEMKNTKIMLHQFMRNIFSESPSEEFPQYPVALQPHVPYAVISYLASLS